MSSRYPSPEELVADAVELASLPEIGVRLNQVVDDPYSDLADIADVISSDPGLAARLLRIANSAMFNFPSPVGTIIHAITVIGTKQLRDLVLATTVVRMFNGIDVKLVDMEQFWRHSIACGIVARVMAAFRRESNIEGIYIMGLLHDMGRLVLYMKEPQLATQMLERVLAEDVPLYEIERQTLGFDHADIGRCLAEAWRLPEALQESVGCHHAPGNAARYPDEAAMVHVADVVVHALELGHSGDPLVPPLSDDAWMQIGLPTSAINSMVEQIDRQYADAVALFLG